MDRQTLSQFEFDVCPDHYMHAVAQALQQRLFLAFVVQLRLACQASPLW